MATYLEGLERIRPLSWEEVFEIWATNEEGNPAWQQVARDRGFESWRQWRRSYAGPLRLPERQWTLYRVTDPMASVPAFLGGPFRAWVEQIYGDAGITPPFSQIAARLTGMKHEGVLKLVASFPATTTITGVIRSDEIVVLEGMHRCGAISVAAATGRSIAKNLMIALGTGLNGDDELFASIVGGHRKGQPAIWRG